MRDIIFIVCDALRYDHVTPELTPNIWEYGQKGIVFTNCQAGDTETETSLPWILSGGEIFSPTSNIMADLRKYGYKSFLIHSNPVIIPFSHGWDGVYHMSPDKGIVQKLKVQYRVRPIMRTIYDLVTRILPVFGTRICTEFYHRLAYLPYCRAKELLQVSFGMLNTQRDSPYFLWIHLMEPHNPYMPEKTHYSTMELEKIHRAKPDSGRYSKGNNPDISPPTPEDIEVWKTLYAQEVREMDIILGEFLSTLKGNEIIIITSDHGEEFGEQGGFGHVAGKYIPELQHVPLIVVDGKRTGEYKHRFDHKDMSILINDLMDGTGEVAH